MALFLQTTEGQQVHDIVYNSSLVFIAVVHCQCVHDAIAVETLKILLVMYVASSPTGPNIKKC